MPEIYQDSLYRNGVLFGHGERHTMPQFLPQGEELIELALDAGWSDGCPSAKELCDPNNEEWGPKKMLYRYIQGNQWFDIAITSALRARNGVLLDNLTMPRARKLPQEAVGVHDPEYVPLSHRISMFGIANPINFAISRVPIELTGRYPNVSVDGDRYAHIIVDTAAKIATSNSDFLIKIAEVVGSPLGIDNPPSVLQHMFDKGIMSEENCPSVFQEIIDRMEMTDSYLLQEYVRLSTAEKDQLGIITL
jgi:hypothetical protein